MLKQPSTPSWILRVATPEDAAAMLAIYRPFVEDTAISFETVCPSAKEFAERIAKIRAGWQWLLAERDGQCLGYVYGTQHRERAAYKWSTEVSVYVRPDQHRQGIGRALYKQLFEDLAAKGYCQAFAGITLPNEGSVALHRHVGFEPIGVFRNVGRKFGRWHDVTWLQRTLREAPPPQEDS